MGLVKRSGGGAKIPPGEKLRFKIERAMEDEGDYGPQAQLKLGVLDGAYAGAEITEWAKLAQPRLTRVEAMREEGHDDAAIARSLKKSGYDFKKKIDEPEEPGVADGGKLFNIAVAAFDGNVQLLDSFGSVADLLEALEGQSFVSITKARGKNGDYAGITWDMVFTDQAATAQTSAGPATKDLEEDLDDLPF
jgi:hypothetical protein